MKKLLLFILTTVSAIGLSVTAGYAASPQLDPGCDPQMMSILTNQANAVRSRDKGYELEILSREPSTLYLTCFDQALALSSRLGLIFSDNFYLNPPPPNKLAFTGTLAYPNWGASYDSGPPPYDNLAAELDVVVSPLLNTWLDSTVPAPATYNFYPQWQASNNQLTTLAKKIEGYLNTIYSDQNGYSGQVTTYNNLVNTIDALVNGLPSDSWQTLPNELTKYNTDISKLQSDVTNLENQEKSDLQTQFNNIKNALMNNQMNCTNLDDMWDGNPSGNFKAPADNTVTSFYSPEGPYATLTPFYSMADLLNYNSGASTRSTPLKIPGPPVAGDPTPSTLYFYTELQDATDNSMLTNALNDLVTPLSKPGASTLWPAPPTLPSYFQTQDVIQQM